MKVSLLDFANPNEVARWDAFAFTRSQLYHDSRWAGIISSVYRFRPFYLFSEEDGEVGSVFPLFRVRFPLLRDELVSIPHLESGGMLNTLPYAEYLDYIRLNLGVSRMKIYQCRERIDDYPANTDDVVLMKDLPGSKDDIIPGMKSATTRNYTRRVLEKDYEVVFENNEEALRDFYRLYLQRMREFGTPPHRFQYMKRIVATFGEDAKILLVRHAGETVGASFYIIFNTCLYNLYLVVPQAYLKERIVYLIQYRAMEMGIERRLKCLVLGRSTKDSGTFHFKTELGGYPVPLHLYHFRLKPGGYAPVEEETVKEKFGGLSGLWTRIPPFIADHAGPIIRKWVY